ncbi:lipopolysaccharide assembly protein LapA domain-containing protein [Alkalihalobacillus sp. MEB130]|uniref:LapA family protein n=1 Tax=Alkalihalobacillus sp. MEB130 TaxID=2976704 RepID=UPI0028DE00F5|nr:lipopolysaccharide assembly protein LapA domain-containing protein [Alkalihalobacillus sp. MEB130]MDT8861538.1 lipopolysaccharide assembly protein LapA domain-containing protein [Alkalihalobacillus sp. MEB130]
MRGQWSLILGLVAAVVIAIFAVINVEAVRVNYMFGVAEWPLILVILGSVLMGAIIVGAVGMLKIYQLQAEIKRLKNKQNDSTKELNHQSNEAKKAAGKSKIKTEKEERFQSKEKNE